MAPDYYVVVRLYDAKNHVEIGMGSCATTGTRSDLKYAAGIAAIQIAPCILTEALRPEEHKACPPCADRGKDICDCTPRVDAAPTDLTIAAQPDHTRRVPATAGPTGHPIIAAEGSDA